jgi:hypothetical protein
MVRIHRTPYGVNIYLEPFCNPFTSPGTVYP